MTTTSDTPRAAEKTAREAHHERRSYLLGTALALVLTLLPFAAVHFRVMPHGELMVLIGVCALLQVVVHFRFFLHISFGHQREDLQLILFSTLLLVIMVAGTLWIMGNLSHRMAMPGSP